ncbi:MAG: PorV/PorQ family protein [Bacteroidota bacterium]|jgi:hypothetical protein
MKKYILQTLVAFIGILATANAGNPDRAGGAGATQLLVNPYVRGVGLSNSNTASARGLESYYLNIGGLAYVKKTEVQASQTRYLVGTDIYLNNFGMAQSLGENGSGGVLGMAFTYWDMGSIPITTTEAPDNTLGTYTTQILNLGLAYSKTFSNSITGGLMIRYVSEGTASVNASGITLDAGVQYQTALNPSKKIKKQDFRFGIAVRNLGPDLSFLGSGLSINSTVTATGASRKTLFGSQPFNMPALANIGVAYDFRLDKGEETYDHRLTVSGNFNYNAFSSNITSFGAEYGFKNMFMIRTGYAHQENNFNDIDYKSPSYGISFGTGFNLPISDAGTALSIDYAYQPTVIFSGIHSIGFKLTLGSKE